MREHLSGRFSLTNTHTLRDRGDSESAQLGPSTEEVTLIGSDNRHCKNVSNYVVSALVLPVVLYFRHTSCSVRTKNRSFGLNESEGLRDKPWVIQDWRKRIIVG